MEPPTASLLPSELETHRAYLYRYALLQLRDADGAQDVVQETLLSALEAKSGFAGRSSLRTWLTGILKHKITDLIRRRFREGVPPSFDGDADDAREHADHYFDRSRNDHWLSPPKPWEDPEQCLEQKRFWEKFEVCVGRLPAQTARVFSMREFMGLSTDEICKELGISSTNCCVILYRARMALRECLEINFLGREAESG